MELAGEEFSAFHGEHKWPNLSPPPPSPKALDPPPAHSAMQQGMQARGQKINTMMPTAIMPEVLRESHLGEVWRWCGGGESQGARE